MAEALIALGGNVGDPQATLNQAVSMLCDGVEVQLRARSSYYRTPPWGDENQPHFLNLCIKVATALSPQSLLERCQAVEHRLGRNRAVERRWGPRTVDLDILAYDDLVLESPVLTLPHPRLFERPFVLLPLAEIAPDRIIAGRRVSDAARLVDGARIQRLPQRK